jgi:hypothetical protein
MAKFIFPLVTEAQAHVHDGMDDEEAQALWAEGTIAKTSFLSAAARLSEFGGVALGHGLGNLVSAGPHT